MKGFAVNASSVYWRRRVVVAVPILVVIAVFASCMMRADGSPAESNEAPSPSPTPSSTPTEQEASTEQDGTKEHPWHPVPGPPPDGVQAAPAASEADTEPEDPVPCDDSMLSVAVAPEHTIYPAGSRLKIEMTVTNTSSQECVRDVGAGQQELTVLSGQNLIWSSDHCNDDTRRNDYTFSPNEALNYWVAWEGRNSGEGCTGGQIVASGDYELVGRVGSAKSSPTVVTLR